MSDQCRWLHRWGLWEVPLTEYKVEERIVGFAQRRSCTRCGKTEMRTVYGLSP